MLILSATLGCLLVAGFSISIIWDTPDFNTAAVLVYSLATLLSASTTILALFSNFQSHKVRSEPLYQSLISLGATLAIIQLFGQGSVMVSAILSVFFIVGNTVIFFGTSAIVLERLASLEKLTLQLSASFAAVFTLISVSFFLAPGKSTSANAILFSGIIRDFGLFLLIIGSSVYNSERSFRRFFQIHSPIYSNILTEAKREPFLSLTLIGSLVFFSLQLFAYEFQQFTNLAATLNPFFISCTVLALCNSRTKAQRSISAQQSLIYQLTPSSAKRFISRHSSESQFVSESNGLRTAHFVIDHDPDSVLNSILPAGLLAIRSAEISRQLHEFMQSSSLHELSFGHRLAHAIDPELSVRPCTDVLRLFAAVYLDAFPRIERKIQQLTEILPIIDQPFTSAFEVKTFQSSFAQINWIFYLDFGWIDQSIVKSDSHVRYVIQQESLSPKISEALLRYIKKTSSGGNYIWLSPSAREKVEQEAPLLLGEIEPCPIQDGENGREFLIFRVKIENLIPILQKFYQLEQMRSKAALSEPSEEGTRMLHILENKVVQSLQLREFTAVVDTIVGFPWQSDKEQERALNLLLIIYNKYSKVRSIRSSNSPGVGKDSEFEELRSTIVKAVQTVGYPCQPLHSALQRNQELRQVTNLLGAAKNPNDLRHVDAWLLLANIGPNRYSPEEKAMALEFLRNIHRLASNSISYSLILPKSIDTFSNMFRTWKDFEIDTINESAVSLCKLLSAGNATLEMWAYLLDTFGYIQARLDNPQLFNVEITREIDQLIVQQRSENQNLIEISDLNYRWQKIKNKSASNLPSELKVG